MSRLFQKKHMDLLVDKIRKDYPDLFERIAFLGLYHGMVLICDHFGLERRPNNELIEEGAQKILQEILALEERR